MAVVEILKAQTSKDPTIMHLLRCLHFQCVSHSLGILATHMPGVENTTADALLRNRPNQFPPRPPPTETAVPQQLWRLVMAFLSDTWGAGQARQLFKAGIAPSNLTDLHSSSEEGTCSSATSYSCSHCQGHVDPVRGQTYTIKGSINHSNILVGSEVSPRHRNPLENGLRLELVLKGVRRKNPRPACPRLPVTPVALAAIKKALHSSMQPCCVQPVVWGYSGFCSQENSLYPLPMRSTPLLDT